MRHFGYIFITTTSIRPTASLSWMHLESMKWKLYLLEKVDALQYVQKFNSTDMKYEGNVELTDSCDISFPTYCTNDSPVGPPDTFPCLWREARTYNKINLYTTKPRIIEILANKSIPCTSLVWWFYAHLHETTSRIRLSFWRMKTTVELFLFMAKVE